MLPERWGQWYSTGSPQLDRGMQIDMIRGLLTTTARAVDAIALLGM